MIGIGVHTYYVYMRTKILYIVSKLRVLLSGCGQKPCINLLRGKGSGDKMWRSAVLDAGFLQERHLCIYHNVLFKLTALGMNIISVFICDHIYKNQPVSEKINYRVRAEVVVQARRR